MQKQNDLLPHQWDKLNKRRDKDYSEEFECWHCGNSLEIKLAEPTERVYCHDCFYKKQRERTELIKQYGILKAQVMLENALRAMEKCGTVYLHEYKSEVDEVLIELTKNTATYKSSYEIIIALVLKNNGYEYSPNHKVLNYRIDFFIPELFTCLEIDGERHKNSLISDNGRDIDIRNHLGSEWETVRVPTEYIDKNPEKIFEMIEGARNLKKSYRSEPGKVKPAFSRREKEHYRQILDG